MLAAAAALRASFFGQISLLVETLLRGLGGGFGVESISAVPMDKSNAEIRNSDLRPESLSGTN